MVTRGGPIDIRKGPSGNRSLAEAGRGLHLGGRSTTARQRLREIFHKRFIEHRVVLTFDLDFGELSRRRKAAWSACCCSRLHARTDHGIGRLQAVLNRQEVSIIGASGSIGSAAVQLAKHFGATVTAVCSGANGDMVRSLGADTVVDYTKEDFTKDARTYGIDDLASDPADVHCRRQETEGRRGDGTSGEDELHRRTCRGGKLKAIIDRSYPQRQSPGSQLDDCNAKADVIVPLFWREPQSKRRTTRPPVAGPTAAAAHPGERAISVRCATHRIEVGVLAAG
jgi:hypothetical protein